MHLGGSCRICGYGRCLSGLEFHHINPLEKDFSISARMTSWEAIRPELDKCILLCANCHREVHEGLHPGYLEDESVRWSDHDDDDVTPDDDEGTHDEEHERLPHLVSPMP